MWSRRWLYEWSGRIGRVLQRAVVRDGRIGRVGGAIARLVPPLGAWTAWRDARPLAPRSFRDEWRDGREFEGLT
jgi:hypothetical protein